jgi:hypothetical protein
MLFNLLKVKQPDLDYEVFSMSISMKQLIAVINAVVWGTEVESSGDEFEGKKKEGEEIPPDSPEG